MTEPSIHANNYDRVADIYDSTRGLSPEAEREVGDGLAAILKENQARTVLEIGVGTGRIAVPLAERGFQVTGIDISTEMLRNLCAKRSDIRVLLAESSALPFRAGSFDAVVFSHILHLVPDAAVAIRAAIACVRRGGLLLNCTHSYAPYPEQRAGERLNEIIREVTGHAGWAHGHRASAEPVLAQTLTGLGATLESREIAHWMDVNTVRREVERLELRANSNTWAIPDDAMPTIVERFTAEALEIFGGLDVESRAVASFRVNIGRLP
ncbi:MAG: methyltransferase domain-containing protein [Anaerolineaceae bacterium]